MVVKLASATWVNGAERAPQLLPKLHSDFLKADFFSKRDGVCDLPALEDPGPAGCKYQHGGTARLLIEPVMKGETGLVVL